MIRKAILALLITVTAAQAAPTFTKKPSVTKAGAGTEISFGVSENTDVEVSILNAKGEVVRHLAAGVLGGKGAPPPPLKPGLSQSLEWDGKDDYGQEIKGGPLGTAKPLDEAGFSARVRVGMGVKLEAIAGGDPYAWYSKDFCTDNHAAWMVSGLEVKPDGKVYVIGNVGHFGPAVVRCYDAEGSYLRTVYPPPAGRPVKEMKGWGTNIREDGSYIFRHSSLRHSSISTSGIVFGKGRVAQLIPTPGNDRLHFVAGKGGAIVGVNTDGTIPDNPKSKGLLVNTPPSADTKARRPAWQVVGDPSVALAPGSQSFYLAGIFAEDGGIFHRRAARVLKDSFWRDGQVFKVDLKTRKAEVFYALKASSVIVDMAKRRRSPIFDQDGNDYAALQGVATDSAGHVFVADRLKKRILVLDASARLIRETALDSPDTLAVNPQSKALYATTRRVGYGKFKGPLRLFKFNDWAKDSTPTKEIVVQPKAGTYTGRTHLGIARKGGKTFVWVAYSGLPIKIYEDTGADLRLAKDFVQVAKQRSLDMQHMVVDPKTETVYVYDGYGNLFSKRDWSTPSFEVCSIAGARRGKMGANRALGFAVDPRNNVFFLRPDRRPVGRYTLKDNVFHPFPLGSAGKNIITPAFHNTWVINVGKGDHGMAVAPDGSLAVLASLANNDYSGPLHYFDHEPGKAPWKGLLFKGFGARPWSAGIRFDPKGNLYVGKREGKSGSLPGNLSKDRQLVDSTAKIVVYAPTGSFKGGNLYPTEPKSPAKVYDVPYGTICRRSYARNPLFGVDPYGRICYPSSLLCRVSLMDNAGNHILRFGTYGNRDSMGGIDGDQVPTPDIPMAFPHSVDTSDDYIYVTDIVNQRALRIRKTFQLETSVKLNQ